MTGAECRRNACIFLCNSKKPCIYHHNRYIDLFPQESREITPNSVRNRAEIGPPPQGDTPGRKQAPVAEPLYGFTGKLIPGIDLFFGGKNS